MAQISRQLLLLCAGLTTVQCFCQRPESPEGGNVACPPVLTAGSRCQFTCDGTIAGPRQVRCIKAAGKFVLRPQHAPTCIEKGPKKCYPHIPAPLDGTAECVDLDDNEETPGTSSNNVISRCTFQCNKHYVIKGAEVSECLKNGRWTEARPSCLRPVCGPFPADDHRMELCTEGHLAGSNCTFVCPSEYKRIGVKDAICEVTSDNGAAQWSNEPPTCELVTCEPPQVAPTNGHMKCTKNNTLKSVCVSRCNEGYAMNGILAFRLRICVAGDTAGPCGKWVGKEPVCTAIVCPPANDPGHGVVTCTKGDMAGSECTYRCDAGFALDEAGTTEKVVTCVATGKVGAWDKELSACIVSL